MAQRKAGGLIQVIVMTSDKQKHMLPGFFYLWQKYYNADVIGIVAGFTRPDSLPTNWRFISQGNQPDYPPKRWSERLMNICDEVADDVFMLLLEDYWLIRPVDTFAIRMMYDYLHQFRNVLKFDLATDRLYAGGGGQYLHGNHTYDTLGYLDLIKSDYNSPYHLSLWGGLWRRDLLRRLLIPGESAQDIEIAGTSRLQALGDEVLVLGTRQAPLRHLNAIQGANWNFGEGVGMGSLKEVDVKHLRELGYEW